MTLAEFWDQETLDFTSWLPDNPVVFIKGLNVTVCSAEGQRSAGLSLML